MQEVAEDAIGDPERDHERRDQHATYATWRGDAPLGCRHKRRHPQESDAHRRFGQEVEAGDRQRERHRRQQGELLWLRASHMSQRGQ